MSRRVGWFLLWLWILWWFFSVLGRLRRQRIIVAICCIDSRRSELRECLRILQCTMARHPIIVDWCLVTRVCDVECQKLAPGRTITVPDYPEPHNPYRHHYDGLARQRTAAWDHARSRGVDLLFIDSDVRIRRDTIDHLRWCAAIFQADIVAVPYGIRWANMRTLVGKMNTNGRIETLDTHPSLLPYWRCHGVGMGCTLLRNDSDRLPSVFRVRTVAGVIGEDVGFCWDAVHNGARIMVAAWAQTPLHDDPDNA